MANRAAVTALKSDGSVITWGNPRDGGDSSYVASSLNQVRAIYSSGFGFIALKDDDTLVTWGLIYPNDYGPSPAPAELQGNISYQVSSTEQR
ncbi:hypothetical protein D3C85_1327780 [compost metagenome]